MMIRGKTTRSVEQNPGMIHLLVMRRGGRQRKKRTEKRGGTETIGRKEL